MDSAGQDNDARLAAAGDADALQRLIVRCHDTLHRTVTRARSAALVHRVDADDVLQRAYVIAFQTCCPTNEADPRSDDVPAAPQTPQFETAGHFYKWVETVALNQLRDIERGLHRQKRDIAREIDLGATPSDSYPDLVLQLAASDTTPSNIVARSEAVAAVMSSLARLPAAQRDILHWRFIQGIPFAEIAQRLGKTEDATYMICHRGLKSLRGLLVSVTAFLTRS